MPQHAEAFPPICTNSTQRARDDSCTGTLSLLLRFRLLDNVESPLEVKVRFTIVVYEARLGGVGPAGHEALRCFLLMN